MSFKIDFYTISFTKWIFSEMLNPPEVIFQVKHYPAGNLSRNSILIQHYLNNGHGNVSSIYKMVTQNMLRAHEGKTVLSDFKKSDL